VGKLKLFLLNLLIAHFDLKHYIALQRFNTWELVSSILNYCSGHTSATTTNSTKSKGTAPEESTWRKSKDKMPRSEMTREAHLWSNRLRRRWQAIGFNHFLGRKFERQAGQTGCSASL